jgi:steroid 5-alpha reductase family enzyme
MGKITKLRKYFNKLRPISNKHVIMNATRKDQLILLIIYIVSFSIGLFIGNSYLEFGLIGKSAIIVFSAVIVIWLFSFLLNNSSIFDPYWSVAPVVFLVYYGGNASGMWHLVYGNWFTSVRFVLLLILVFVYGVRLTWNFLRNWRGLKHEDWRYVDFREKTGSLYWVVSFLGIHLFPAIMVFMGTLSILVAVTAGIRPVNLLDMLGITLTGTAILLEAKADKQLHEFVANNKEEGKTMDTGLWSVSRHPNYLGEMSFWWGLFFFALAANPSYWWVLIGPLSITLMFIFISIPLIEKRLLNRKKDYAEYCKRVPMLFPFPIKNLFN